MISLRNQFHHAVNIGVTQWCCDGSMTDVQVELTASEANRLRKWGSLWFDLLHADMAMYERQNLPNTAANVFTRRALWESAVISYGRMQFSDKKRKLTHEDLLRAAGGEKALAFHERLSQWRHNHIAHRLSPEYETTAAVARYAETGQPGLETLDLGVDVDWTFRRLSLSGGVQGTPKGASGQPLADLPRAHRRSAGAAATGERCGRSELRTAGIRRRAPVSDVHALGAVVWHRRLSRNPLSGYRLDRGRIRPYAASNTSPTYRTMHNLGSIVAEEAVQHGPAYPKVFRDVLAGVTVGLHPGGSAACGRPLLAMYRMVAGCGGQDESRRERHTIGKVAVHGGARNAQHLRDVIRVRDGRRASAQPAGEHLAQAGNSCV